VPVFALSQDLCFPSPELAEPDGLLAVGGDLRPERLLLAYSMGIFPWFNPGDPLLWWSPDPRCVLEPAHLHISGSLRKDLRRGRFSVTFNGAFAKVIASCAEVREECGEGTWLGQEMIDAYLHLHQLGFAHSVEVWRGRDLVGGLYGVALGRCFFGESMFHRQSNASKVGMANLARHLAEKEFELIDCQLPNPHLFSLGAKEISRPDFLNRLRRGGVVPSIRPHRAEI